MTSPTKTLTAQFVRTVQRPGKYFDGPRGKRPELDLGSPALISLAEAREKALANRKLVYAGGDSLAERRKVRAILTFEQAAKKAHIELLPTWKNPRDQAAFCRRFRCTFSLVLGPCLFPT
ncbi:integrase arm-type DNA-binding domain-containing protein [Shinella sp. BYT-45]|uniref:integrase arm-type DNA-binding domain-containing protein n=1 Tax=Shinella sp. BYT-45 TaxID=3377377 RepID=UPI00397F81A9